MADYQTKLILGFIQVHTHARLSCHPTESIWTGQSQVWS